MLEIFLCCAPRDREVARTVADRLEDTAEVTVVLDDGQSETVAVTWEGGLSSAAILLLLSPESVPPQVNRTNWGPVLDHITSNAEPPIGSLVVRSCEYPRILERKHFFRWDNGPRDTLRAIQEWALALHRLPQERSFRPARLMQFEGRENELDLLWETLVDRAGCAVLVNQAPATGKTSLAQEFSRRAAAHFRDILWIACGDRSPALISANLAERLGTNAEGEAGEAFAALMDLAGEHRVLVVFDGLPPALAIPDRHGRASLLVITRATQIKAPRAARIVRLGELPGCPIAVPSNPVDLGLWRAMAVCRPDAFPLELAVQIAGIDPAGAQAACTRLIQSRLVDPLDHVNGWMRLSVASVAAAGDALESERRRHAEIVSENASDWSNRPDFSKRYTAEVIPAFRWAAGGDWPLACGIIRRAFACLRHYGHLAAAAELLVVLRDAAEERCEWEVSDECTWELSWIRGLPYRGASRAHMDGDQLHFDFGG